MLTKSKLAAAISIQVALSVVALAQEGVKGNAVEEIVVTGTRGDLKSALLDKRDSDVLLDSLVAEDIGNLPDVNIADSLQRVPGVQVQRNDRGQTANISIRGLPSSFTQVLYNGRAVSTVFNERLSNRNFQAFVVPSTFVRKLGVAKTSKADITEGGIAGTVNVESQRAFNYDDRTFAFDTRIRSESNSGALSQSYSALFADQYADNTIGFLLGVSWNEELPDLHRARGGQYASTRNEADGRDLNGDGDFTDQGIIVRNNIVLENFKQNRERMALVSNLEFRPNDNFKLLFDVLYADQDTENDRESIRIDVRNTDTISSEQRSAIMGDNEYVTRYASLGALVRPEGEVQFRNNELFVGQITADWILGDWEVGVSAGHNESAQAQDRFRAVANGPRIPITVDFATTSTPPIFDLSDAARATLLDPSEYSIRQLTNGPGVNIANKAEQSDLYLDFTRNFDGGFINSFQFGGSYSENSFNSNRDTLNLSAGELAALGVTGFDFFESVPQSGTFLGAGGVSVPQSFIVADVRTILNQFTTDQLLDADTGSVRNNPADIVDIDEEFVAFYTQLNFSSEDNQLSGNVGLRYVQTDETIAGSSTDLTAGFTRDPSDGSLEANRIGETTRSRSYDNLLPSLNLRYNINDNPWCIMKAPL